MEERLCRMPESKLLNQSINQSINQLTLLYLPFSHNERAFSMQSIYPNFKNVSLLMPQRPLWLAEISGFVSFVWGVLYGMCSAISHYVYAIKSLIINTSSIVAENTLSMQGRIQGGVFGVWRPPPPSWVLF